MRNRRTIRLALPEGDALPTEFRLFTAGEVRTEKGVFVFDEEAAELVLQGVERRKTALMLDYNHASLDPKPLDPERAARAAGWHDVELRNGELWATNVRWTEAAAAGIRAKEWRYYSPAFLDDPKTGRIVDYINCALTNLPATHDLTPLVAASRARDLRKTKLSSGPSFSDITRALIAALEARHGEPRDMGGPWLQDVYEDAVVYEFDGKLWRIGYRIENSKAELIGDPIEVRHSYEPLAKDNPMTEEKETTAAALAKALEESKAKDETIAKLEAEIEEMKAKLAKAEAAPEGEKKDEEAQLIAAARQITGRTDLAEVKGALLALSQSHGQVQALATEVAALKAQRANDEVTAIVDEAIRAGKVTPAKRDEFIQLGRDSRKALETTLSMLVPMVATQPLQAPAVDAATIVLSREDEEIIRKNNLDREKFIAARKRQLERGLITQ